jgi:hypothetical protein
MRKKERIEEREREREEEEEEEEKTKMPKIDTKGNNVTKNYYLIFLSLLGVKHA